MDTVNKKFSKSSLKVVLDKIFVIPLPVCYQFKKAYMNFQGKQIKLKGTFPTGTTHANFTTLMEAISITVVCLRLERTKSVSN